MLVIVSLVLIAMIIVGIWGLKRTHNQRKLSNEEYKKGVELPGKLLFGESYDLGEIPKDVRKLRASISYVLYSILISHYFNSR